MEETKSMFLSKSVGGGFATMLMGLLMIVGAVQPGTIEVGPIDGIDPNDIGQVVQAAEGGGAVLAGVITMVLGALAIFFRVVAKKRLLLLIAAMFLIAGCTSPDYSRVIGQSAIVVGELNTRCQDGDDLACKEGVRVASDMLDLLVDGGKGAGHE